MALFVEAGLSNALTATVLALLVAVTTACCRRPALVHSLWLLVLLRFLVPPVLPVSLPWPSQPSSAEVLPEAVARPVDSPLPEHAASSSASFAEIPAAPVLTTAAAVLPAIEQATWPAWWQLVGAVWLIGSGSWLLLACGRAYRFGRLLRYAQPASPREQEHVRQLATRIGLQQSPRVWFLPATVSPMLGALLGPPRLLIPAALWQALAAEQRDTLLLHELAHLRRRDHWVRRLEFVVLALYWWHPIVWWARWQVQEAEEQCCDAWVATVLPAAVPAYAEALVATITFLSQARSALPLGASGMGHARLLRRRLTMILHGTTPRGLSAAGLAAVVVLGAVALPLLPTLARSSPAQAADADAPKGLERADTPHDRAPVGIAVEDTAERPGRVVGSSAAALPHRGEAESVEDARDQVDLLHAQLQAKQAELNEVKTRLQQSQRQLERQQRLAKTGAISQDILEQTETELAVQKARLLGKEAEVKEAEIRHRQATRLLGKLRGDSGQTGRQRPRTAGGGVAPPGAAGAYPKMPPDLPGAEGRGSSALPKGRSRSDEANGLPKGAGMAPGAMMSGMPPAYPKGAALPPGGMMPGMPGMGGPAAGAPGMAVGRRPAGSPEASSDKERRLNELEQHLSTLLKEVEALRRELRPEGSNDPRSRR